MSDVKMNIEINYDAMADFENSVIETHNSKESSLIYGIKTHYIKAEICANYKARTNMTLYKITASREFLIFKLGSNFAMKRTKSLKFQKMLRNEVGQ